MSSGASSVVVCMEAQDKRTKLDFFYVIVCVVDEDRYLSGCKLVNFTCMEFCECRLRLVRGCECGGRHVLSGTCRIYIYMCCWCVVDFVCAVGMLRVKRSVCVCVCL